jgi:hypothetical protein
VAHELPMPVSCWWWWRWWSLVHLSLHVGDSVRYVGKQLSLGGEKLLHPCRWRLVGLTWLRIRVGVVARSLSRHCRLINSRPGPGVHHLIGYKNETHEINHGERV